jgi:hypothetical protein
MTQEKIILERVIGRHLPQSPGDIARGIPGLGLSRGPAEAPADFENMGIKRYGQIPLVHKLPDTRVNGILSHHPAQIKIPPLKRIRQQLFWKKEDEAIAVSAKVTFPQSPQGFADVSIVVRFDRCSDGAILLQNSSQRFEQIDDLFALMEAVVHGAQHREIAPGNECVRALTHPAKQVGKECFHCLDVAVRELRCDEARYLSVPTLFVLVDKRYWVPLDEPRKLCFFPVVNLVQDNDLVLFGEL